MEKNRHYRYWYLLCCLVTQGSFCGKIKSVFLERDVHSKEADEHAYWREQKSGTIEQPLFGRHRVVYNKSLFGPSLFDKKACQKSGLRRSPPSDNLFCDSNDSDTQSSISRESLSSLSSRASTPELSEPLHRTRLSAVALTVVIPRRHVEECDKPILIATPVCLFKGLGLSH